MEYIAEQLRHFALPVESLSLDPANARKHNARNLQAITESLRRFGQRFPLVHDSKFVVRIGNGRLQAARAMGWEFVASVLMEDLSEPQLRALALADNRTAELAEWNFGKLAESVEKLKDYDLSDYWNGAEIDAILNFDTTPKQKEKPDASPAEPPPDSAERDDVSPAKEHWYTCPRCQRKFLEGNPAADAPPETTAADLIPELLSLTLARPAQNSLRSVQFPSARRWDKALKRQAGTLYKELIVSATAALARTAADELLPLIRDAGLRPRMVTGAGSAIADAIAECLAATLEAEHAALFTLDADGKPTLTPGDLPAGPCLIVECSAGDGRLLEAAAKLVRDKGMMTFAAAWIYENATRL